MRTLFTVLSERRAAIQNDQDRQKGFTLIELLVVVIIIGILAAIAIPVYLGIQNSAKESGVQSDVANAKIGMVAMQTANGTLPSAVAGATTLTGVTTDAAKYGFTMSDNTASLTISLTDTGTAGPGFCVSGLSNTSPAVSFAASDLVGAKKGTCNAGVFAPPTTPAQ